MVPTVISLYQSTCANFPSLDCLGLITKCSRVRLSQFYPGFMIRMKCLLLVSFGNIFLKTISIKLELSPVDIFKFQYFQILNCYFYLCLLETEESVPEKISTFESPHFQVGHPPHLSVRSSVRPNFSDMVLLARIQFRLENKSGLTQ